MMNGPKIRQILSFKLEHDRDGQKFRNLNLKQQKKNVTTKYENFHLNIFQWR